jgi:hypothetical protein
VPGFRVTEANVERAAARLKETLKSSNRRTIVVYQLYDNSVFFSSQEDGSRSLPVKDPADNIYHVPGKLAVADHQVLKKLVHMTVPLLRAGGDCEKVIMSPLPRYIKRCCGDRDHITNKKEKSFCEILGNSLASMRDTIRDVVFSKKIRSFKAVSPILLLTDPDTDEETANKRLKSLWKEDPIHMAAEGYSDLVHNIAEMAVNCSFTRNQHSDEPPLSLCRTITSRESSG